MSRPVVVLRPEPGNAATVARVRACGLTSLSLPLFEVRAVAWSVPDLRDHDALILTSANAVRHAGPGLAALAGLPVFAVGSATAAAARSAGLQVVATGDEDAGTLLRRAAEKGIARALHLAGRDRVAIEPEAITRTLTVYASDPVAISDATIQSLTGSVVLLHSSRAAERFVTLADGAKLERKGIRIAALSEAIARASGRGWGDVETADAPDDDRLIAIAERLAD